MTKKIIILNITLLLIILLDKPIVSFFSVNMAISFDQTKNITGFGKVDIFNNKQGEWIYRNSVGNVLLVGNYKDNKKEGVWILHETDEYLQKSNFRNDTIWGMSKRFHNGDLIEIIFHGCGDDYYGTTLYDKYGYGIIDWISEAHKEDHELDINFARRVIKEEFGINNDESFNHKENGFDTLFPVVGKYEYLFDLNVCFSDWYYILSDDRFMITNPFERYINVFNYILIIVLIISNIVLITIKQ